MQLRPARPAFTLIEVLVVTAIIALLIGILMPTLAQARHVARSTACKASIRQLGTGMNMYLDQYRSYPAHQWILNKPEGQLRIRWFNAMARLVSGYKVQSCPTVPDWEVGRNNSYGYNYKYLGSGRDNAISPTAPLERFPVKSLRAPSDTIAFGDTDGTGWERPYMRGEVKDQYMIGNHGYTLDPTYVPVYSEETFSDGVRERYAWKDFRTYISTRHMGGSNLCFADGSANSLTPRQVYQTNKLWNGLGSEDPIRDPHVSERYYSSNPDVRWRFPDI